MKLQILVATMHQNDLLISEKMNIRCGAVIANQADREEIITEKKDSGDIKMITTSTRGVGLNRNIALMAADADIVLFADDDMVYYDGTAQAVVDAFRQLPQADVILFGVDILKGGKITEKRRTPIQKMHIWNSMRFGTYRIAARRSALVQNNITFHQSFGGGCPFSAGEDSLFLKTCFDKGLKVYSHTHVLGTCCKDSSSWFVGYNEKFFYDKGVLVRQLFPKVHYLIAWYFGARFRDTDFSLFKRLRLVYDGVRGGKTMSPYKSDI